jgi:phosphinothricin acetyltransferase
VEIRDASAADMSAIAAIHNELLDSTTYTWTDHHQTVQERETVWLARNGRGFPTLVAAEGSRVLGFASYADFRDSLKWPGYRFSVEHSINVTRAAWGSGLAQQLMAALIERAQRAGLHAMIGGIDASNIRSLQFHARLGFREVARMPETGWKHQRWCELVLVQRLLASRA